LNGAAGPVTHMDRALSETTNQAHQLRTLRRKWP
jgi:hypothetical protein